MGILDFIHKTLDSVIQGILGFFITTYSIIYIFFVTYLALFPITIPITIILLVVFMLL